jgi:restriction system protein
VEAVQQIIGAKSYYKADKCMVITNNYFSPNAKELAGKSNVELWDRKKLIEIMGRTDGIKAAGEVSNTSEVRKRVICSKCGSEMVLRHGKNGDFYECSRYPRCRNTKGTFHKSS